MVEKRSKNLINLIIMENQKAKLNDIFWWNLIPAVMITIEFIIINNNSIILFIAGFIGMLNWCVVILEFIKYIKEVRKINKLKI
jgi:hypothetical protein